MHLQAALRQASLKLCFESLRFLLVTAVHQSVICIPTPREFRVCPRHPEIERVMEENVRQNWADHTTLRCAAVSLDCGSIFLLHWRSQPSSDVQQRPLTRHMFPKASNLRCFSANSGLLIFMAVSYISCVRQVWSRLGQ